MNIFNTTIPSESLIEYIPTCLLATIGFLPTSKTPYVAIEERGLVRSIHLFLFSCVH